MKGVLSMLPDWVPGKQTWVCFDRYLSISYNGEWWALWRGEAVDQRGRGHMAPESTKKYKIKIAEKFSTTIYFFIWLNIK